MKFSLIYEAQTQDTSRAGDAQILTEIVEQAVLAEEVGFDVVWAVEHTALEQYAHMSVPETFLAYIAGRTSRIGIGHGVICLPPKMNHPVKVAERTAALDILSGGRLHVGFGKGGTQQEAGTFGYQLEDLPPMITEAMYLVPRLWVEDPFTGHDGQFVSIPPRPIHPKPLQEPHPPVYMACTHNETLETAGERGIGALVLGFGGPEQVAEKNRIYRKSFAERDPSAQVGLLPTEHLAALCPAVVLADGEEARRIGLRGQRFFMESIGHWGSNGASPLPDPSTWGDELVGTSGDGKPILAQIGREVVTFDPSQVSMELLNPNHAYGTVEDCIGYVERLIEAGADEILFLNQMGTIPQWAMLETIRNIGEHVIPHFNGNG
jgi:alkanesulfonate monooxygenase SsuD/methylene tetrahydromethanopterin reductase-like flavin-dependent oxidoreductase (luciferase family)